MLPGGCFKSLTDDERTFMNSLLRRGYFFILKKCLDPWEEAGNERVSFKFFAF